eukprot:641488-Prymnesium_polylepis.1
MIKERATYDQPGFRSAGVGYDTARPVSSAVGTMSSVCALALVATVTPVRRRRRLLLSESTTGPPARLPPLRLAWSPRSLRRH